MTAIAEDRKAIGEAKRDDRTVREAVRVRDEVRERVDYGDGRPLADLHIRSAGARLAYQATAARRGCEAVTPGHEIRKPSVSRRPSARSLSSGRRGSRTTVWVRVTSARSIR